MVHLSVAACPWIVLSLGLAAVSTAEEPVHVRIDSLILAGAGGLPRAASADDAEFFRRVNLDFVGVIPTAEAMRAFVADPDRNKRSTVIDSLLNGPGYARRMAEWFHVHLMERRADHDLWMGWLAPRSSALSARDRSALRQPGAVSL